MEPRHLDPKLTYTLISAGCIAFIWGTFAALERLPIRHRY